MNGETNFLEGSPKEHFYFGHIGIIAACAALLIGITVMKHGFVLPFGKKAREQPVKELTYEEVKRRVVAENDLIFQSPNEPALAEEINSKLALVDPSFQQGQVAGASTGTEDSLLELAEAQAALSPSALLEIKINQTAAFGLQAVKKYAGDVVMAEVDYDSLGSLSSLGGADKASLESASENFSLLIAALSQIEVPAELAEYHRLKIFYYGAASAIADAHLQKPEAGDLDELMAMFFAAVEKMEKIEREILQKYQIEL